MVELHSVAGPSAATNDPEVDPDDRVAVFELSPASAEQVTIQIRSLMERAWEYIAIAYQGRAHLALGYPSWDEYVDDRLGDLRLTVPREQRGAVVQSLSKAQMSLRAIAKVLGVSVATAYRDLASGGSESPDAGESAPIAVKGRDGKEYPNRRKIEVRACAICGDAHEADIDECPWDLFAQGLGPRPDSGGRQDDEQSDQEVPSVTNHDDCSPDGLAPSQVLGSSVVDDVTRAVCVIEELSGLPELVDEIEAVAASWGMVASHPDLVNRVRELIEHIRLHVEVIAGLVSRLERVAGSG
ncbi:helix-turn-helix domain-containing protein [Nakamurella sp.]|uniref:helix-turn-helix domain-containing protein n=1 Tax=Nakamurella sp. TaxID=1869182 RepID=UPI003B3B1544